MRSWTMATLAAALMLGACDNISVPQTSVRLIASTAFPVLPDLDHPRFDAVPVQWNMPRGPDGEPRIDEHIFVGLDQENFERLNINLARLRATIAGYRARIDEVNRQRAEWRRQAEQSAAPPRTP